MNEHEELPVTFSPPLYLQRRLWILNLLRRENIADVLDVGCGEGSLLSTLCQSAPWLPTENLLAEDGPHNNFKYLYPTRARGLDINEMDLNFAIESTKPRGDHDSPMAFSHALPRWQDLSTQIWKGGLEVINEEFVNTECIVSTEVIEHLTPDVLPAFGPMLLGVYHPKFFLVTTPSYSFNARFTPPDAPSSVRQGFPDPTGRTERIFRHQDHKFEWTEEEFSSWCNEEADAWGYDVAIDGLGSPMEADPYGRTFHGASQVAIFTRSDEDVKWREEKGRKLITDLAFTAPAHELLADEIHQAHPLSDKPSSLPSVSKAVVDMMESIPCTIIRFEDLWFQFDGIPLLCGGRIDVLADAITSSPEVLDFQRDWTLHVGNNRGEWNVRLVQGLPTPRPPLVGHSSLDYIAPGVDWIPSEGFDDEDDDNVPPSEWSGVDGDVSRDGSETDEPSDLETPDSGWGWSAGTAFTEVQGNPPRKTPDGSSQKKPVVCYNGWRDCDDSSGAGDEGWGSVTGGWDADQSQDEIAST